MNPSRTTLLPCIFVWIICRVNLIKACLSYNHGLPCSEKYYLVIICQVHATKHVKKYFCVVYDCVGRADLSNGYGNPKKKKKENWG